MAAFKVCGGGAKCRVCGQWITTGSWACRMEGGGLRHQDCANVWLHRQQAARKMPGDTDRDRKRAACRTVGCPSCGADPGYPCKRKDGGVRASNHASRWDVFDRLLEAGASP